MRLNRLLIVFGMLMVAVVIGTLRQRSLQALRRSNDRLSDQIQQARIQVDGLHSEAEPLRRELAERRADRDAAAAKAAGLARELSPGNADARWSVPPDHLPDWDPESPYVWLDKALLTRFPFQPFSPEGTLNSSVAAVLTVDPEQLARLNDNVTRLVAEYRAEEAAHAQITRPETAGTSAAEDGSLTLTIPPQPELAAAYREQFEQILVGELGRPRTELVLKAAGQWLHEQVGGFGTEPRSFSVSRQADNAYQILITSGSSQMSVGGAGGAEEILPYIPSHLRPLLDLPNPTPVTSSTRDP